MKRNKGMLLIFFLFAISCGSSHMGKGMGNEQADEKTLHRKPSIDGVGRPHKVASAHQTNEFAKSSMTNEAARVLEDPYNKHVFDLVNTRLVEIRDCYEEMLKTDRTLSGRITAKFTIARTGEVSKAMTTINEIAPEMGECILGVIRSIKFDANEPRDLTFEFPFVFTPKDSKEERP